MNWKEFIQNPQNDKTPRKGVMMIILQKHMRPQPVFSLLLQKATFNPEEYGYAVQNGKVVREGRTYLSIDMKNLADWCKQYNIKYSFDLPINDEPGIDDIYLQLNGDFSEMAIQSFPIEYEYMYIRGEE